MRTNPSLTLVAALAIVLTAGGAWARPGGGRSGGGRSASGRSAGGRSAGGRSVGGRSAGGRSGAATRSRPSSSPRGSRPSAKSRPKSGGKNLGGNDRGRKNLGGRPNQFPSSRPTAAGLNGFLGTGSFPRAANGRPGSQLQASQLSGSRLAGSQFSAAQIQGQAQQITANLQGQASAVFTPQWYAAHPNAWQATHPNANVWAAATFGAVATWAGLAAQPTGSSEVVYVEQSGEQYAEDQPADEPDGEEAALLAAADVPPAKSDDWMPLGVFAISPAGQPNTHTFVQLAVSRQGAIEGSYFDQLSGSAQPVQGSLDKQTQKVGWKVGSGAVFETSVETLTSDQGPVAVYFDGGGRQTWALVRVDENTEGATDENPADSRKK